MHRVIVSLCLLSLSLARSVYGQDAGTAPAGPEPADTSSDSGVVSYGSYSGGATYGNPSYLVNGRYMSGSGVGYLGSYYQVGGFRPFWLSDDAFIAPEARAMLTNDGQWGGNFGGLARRYLESRDRIIGAYGYFDTDSQYNQRFNQGSFGVETLGNWDLRINGYIPLGNQDSLVSNGAPLCVMGDPFFQGNNIVFNGVQAQNRAQALTGGDIEFGIPVAPQWQWLRANAGAYYYTSNQLAPVPVDAAIPNQQDKNPIGVRARLDAWLTDTVLASVNVTSDTVWGTNVNAVIDIRFSGMNPTRFYPNFSTRERMMQPVQRNWRVAVMQYGTAVNTPIEAVNPTTGKPYFVEFINNTAAPGGDGSFEHPFDSFNHPNGIPNADLILVARGDSTLANPYIGTMKLFDNQRLIGEGSQGIAPLPLSAVYGNCSVAGNFALPGYGNGDGNFPFVQSGSGGPIVTLANNNEVTAFNFIGSGGDAIVGNGIRDFNLHDLEISGNAGRGIALTGASGANTVISNINLGSVNSPNPNGYGNNAGGGIFVSAGPSSLTNLKLTNVNMNSSPAGTQPFGVWLSGVQGSINTTLTNVNVNGNGTGLKLDETNHSLVANLLGVSANGNVNDGVDITGVNGSVTINALNGGLPLVANGNGGTGILYTQTGGTGLINLTGVQANNNGLDGIGLVNSAATTTTNIVNGTINSNARDGIHNPISNGSNSIVNVDPTQVSNNGRDGYFASVTGGSSLIKNFTDDTLNNNGRSAFYITLDNGSVTSAITNTSGQFSTLNGLHVDAANGSTFVSNINGSTLSNNTGAGIDIQLLSGSSATINSSLSQINNNTQNGVFVSAAGLSNFHGAFDNSQIIGNGGNGVRLSLDNSPSSTLAVTGGTSVSNNGTNGVLVDATNVTNLTPTIGNAVISSNTLDGLRFNVASGSTVGAGSITNSSIFDNKNSGLEVNVAGANSSSDFTITNSLITNSAGIAPQQNALLFNVTTGGQFAANITGSNLSKNSLHAINGTVTGTGAAGSSSATVLLDGVDASGSGFTNAALVASQGGLLNFTAQGNTSLSNSVNGAGVLVSVTGSTTVANVDIDNSVVNGNATIGYGASVIDGTLNSCLEGSSFSFNQQQGLLIDVSGPTGVAYYGVGTLTPGSQVTVSNNGQEGLLATATNLGTINYRSIGSHYDGNGTTGSFDGASFATDNATIRALFHGGTTNNNTRDGLRVAGNPPLLNTNGSNITLSLANGFTSSGNAGFALDFDVKNANTAFLLVDPVVPPVLNGPINLDYSGVNQAFANLSGVFHFDNKPGAGLAANFSNAGVVVFSLDGQGTSTANNNGAAGLDINLTNVTNGSILIKGFSDISGNTGDGIHVSMTDVTNGALELQGVTGGTTMTGNGGNGVKVELTNTNLVNNFNSILNQTIIGLTVTDNQAFDSCLPLPVSVAANFAGVVPTKALTVDSFTVSGSGAEGITVDGTNVTIGTNGGSISNNVVTGSLGGDGIRLSIQNPALVNPTADGFRFASNSSTSNSGNGINIDLTNVTMNNMDLSGAMVASDNGLEGVRIDLDNASITPTTGPASIVASLNSGNGVFINAVNNSNLFLSTNSLIANSNTLAGFNGTALSGSKVNIAMGNPSQLTNNGEQGLTMTVSGANSSSLFNVNTLTASNNGAQGLLTTVSAGGNLDFRSIASTYNTNGTGATKYDGVDMRVNGNTSTLLSLFDGGSANGNGRDGYHFGGLTDAGSLAGATLTASLNNGVGATGNGRDSLNFDALSGSKAALLNSGFPLTLTGPANLNFTSVSQTAVANLTGTFQFNSNAAGSGLTAKFSSANTAIFNLNGLGGSAANGNSGSGLDISMSGVTNGSVQLAGFVTANSNGADGIKVLMNNVTTGALNLQGVNSKTLLNGNAGNGLNTQLTNVNLINNFGSTVAVPTISQLTTSSNQPAPYAVLPLPVTGPLSLAGMTPVTGYNVNNFSATGNSLGGVIVDATRLTIANGGSMSGNVGNGNNGGDGISLKINDSALVGATANNFLFNNNSATGNTGNGVHLDLNKLAMNNLSMTTIVANTNTLDGLHIDLTESSVTPTTGPSSVAAFGNQGNGVFINSNNASNIFLNIGQLTANGNTLAGFNGSALAGSQLNIALGNPSSVSSNGLQGLNVTVDGAGSSSLFNVNNLSANNNTQQGLLATVSNGGNLDYRSLFSFYNGNGTGATKFDGVDMRVNGATSKLLTLFDVGSSAGGNGRDGYHFGGLTDGGSLAGATLTASLNNGATAITNGRYALNFDALNGGAANLLTSSVNPPVFNGPINLNFAGVTTTAIANLNGTFHFDNNAAGNGLTANFNGANTAIFNLNGTGTSTANGNSLGGINVSMANVTNGSVRVAGFSSASGNLGGDGIHVDMTNVTNGALQLQGLAGGTNVSGNSGSGVTTVLSNVNLINNFNTVVSAPTVEFLTTTSNQPNPYAVLPLPVTGPISLTGMVPTTGFTVNNFFASANSGGGVLVDGTDVAIADGGSMSNIVANSNTGGDGIRLTLNNAALKNANGFLFNNNSATFNNSGDGIQVGLTNVAMDNSQFKGLTGSNNNGDGISLSLLNSTMNNVDLTGAIVASNNGGDGLFVSLDNSSMTPTTGPTSVTANANAFDGVVIDASNNSNIFMDIGTLTANNNVAGSGFSGTALTGSSLNICLDNPSSVSNNNGAGLELLVSGAGSTGNVNVDTLTANANANQGLLATVSAGGVLNYRSLNSTYNNNVGGDGVDMRVDGATTVLRTLFTGGSANGNGRDGYHIGGLTDGASVNGASITASLSGVTGTGDTRFGLNFNTPNASQANLLMDPASSSTFGPNNNVNVSNATQSVVLQLNGVSFASGLNLVFNKTISGITSAFVSLDGNNVATIDGGLSVTMNGLDTGSLQVVDYAALNNTAGTAVNVLIDGTSATAGFTNAAIDIENTTGLTNMAVTGGNGVNVLAVNTHLIQNLATTATLPTVIGLTTTSNQAAPLDCLALPVALNLTTAGLIPADALNISDLNISGAGAGGNAGIIFVGVDSTIAANDGFITNNTVTGSFGGSAIEMQMISTGATGPMMNGLLIDGNTVTGTGPAPVASGIRLLGINGGATGSPFDNIKITNNTVTDTNGEGILFLAVNPTGSPSTVNNLLIDSNTATGNGSNGLVVVVDSATMANLSTTNNTFDNNGSSGMQFSLGNASISGWTGTGSASNNDNAGLIAILNNTSSVTNANFTNMTFDQNGADGVSFITADATTSTFGTAIAPVTFTGGSISDNGRLVPGSGVNLNTVANGTVANLVFNNVAIDNNLPNTSQQNGLLYTIASTGGTVNAAFTGGSISNNAVDAINGTINGTGVANGSSSTISLTGTTADGSGSTGALFTVNNVGKLTLTVQDDAGTASSISGSGADGIQINATGLNTQVAATILNSDILNNGANLLAASRNGFSGIFDNGATGTLTVTGSTIGNTTGTQQDGIYLNLNGTTPNLATDVIANVTNSILSSNQTSALEVIAVGTGAVPTNGAHVTFDTVTADFSGGMGVALNASAGGLINFTALNSTSISNSTQNGMFLSATGADTLLTVSLADTFVNNNGSNVFAGDGINGTVLAGARLNVEGSTTGLVPTSFNGNKGDGIDIFVSGVSSRADVDLHNATVGIVGSGNTLNGFQFQSLDGGEFNLQAYQTAFNGNGGAGLAGTVTNSAGVDTIGRIRIVGGSADSNTGSGFDLQGSNTTGGPTGIATLTAMFQADENGTGISSQNNGGFGLNFVTTSTVQSTPTAGTVGNLLMTGPSTLNGNTAGTVNISMDKALQAIVGLSGTFDGSSGDGIGISLTNISDLALVSVQGPGEVSGNAGNGINVNLQNAHNGVVFIGGFTDVSNNGLDGIKVTMDNVGADFGAGTGHGVLTINGTTTAVPGNTMNVSNNGGNGINTSFINGSIIDNSFAPAILGGVSNQVSLIVNNGDANPATNLLPPPPLPVVPTLPAGQPMLETQLQNVSTPLGLTFGNTVSIENVNLDANGTTNVLNGVGIQYTVDGSQVVGSTLVENVNISDTGTVGTNHSGMVVSFLNGANVTGLDVVDSSITNSFGDGFRMLNPYMTTTPFALNFTRATMTGNTNNGIDITLPNLSLLNPTLNLTLTNTTVSNNGTAGVSGTDSNGLFVDASNTLNSTALVNVNILSDNTTANAVSGLFQSQFNSNRGMGVFLSASDTFAANQATISLNVSGTGGTNNFNSNGDAGVGFLLAGTAHGTATASNATFNNNVLRNLHGTNFRGDGFAVFLQGTAAAPPQATFDNSTLGDVALNNTQFNSNAGSGFRMTTSLNGSSDSLTIRHATITGNATNGITFTRNAGVLSPGPYITNAVIDNSTITGNTGRGIDILSEFADGADDYTITNNTISNNTSHGVSLFTLADADVLAVMDNNTISSNGGSGIFATQNLAGTDIGIVTAFVTNSTITSNTLNGIDITAAHRIDIGQDQTATIGSNRISNNGLTGITITGASAQQVGIGPGATVLPDTDHIVSNAIRNNGSHGVVINSIGSESIVIQNNNALITAPGGQLGGINNNNGDGIQLNAIGSRIVATVDSNDVLTNAQDGIQLLVSNTGASLLTANTVTITGNDVEDSGRRGINILNAANNRTNLTIGGTTAALQNVVTRSQLEGVYIVNTSTTGALGNGGGGVQGVDALANLAMATSDTFTNDPRLALHVINNVITSNGQAANGTVFDATGFVLRVGSSDGNSFAADGAALSYQNNGGNASNLTSAGLAGAFSVANVIRGGVAANIEQNTFGGDYNSDVTFQAFRSTTDPTTTVGTWTDQNEGDSTAGPPVPRNPGNDAFSVTTYVQDPLSRLDLRFTNTNTGDGMVATRSDVFTSLNPAFYNNNEAVFKSRTASQDGNDPTVGGGNAANQSVNDDGGPFASGTRHRILTRLASNAAPYNAPRGVGTVVDVAVNGFLYPGVGASTWRRSTDTSSAGFANVPVGNDFGDTVTDPAATAPDTFAWDVLP
ncbi:MAG: right-handed parallel beta-helix repeat-containing protein [Planctomycetaceae bacterium]